MGIFTEVSGTIQIRTNSGCSVRQIIDSHFDCKCRYDQITDRVHNVINITVNFTFCSDGVHAAKQIQQFCDMIKTYDAKTYVDLYATIRFF